jgi:ATP-dependent DNA ligase
VPGAATRPGVSSQLRSAQHPLSEFTALDRWIRQPTTERFGPVRAVQPAQVFELAFEGLQRSSRHKSGIALLEAQA